MKHASEKTLSSIKDVLKSIRQNKFLKEKKKGVFYKQSQAFIHFHEDLGGLFADLKTNNEWKRFPVNTRNEKEHFLKEAKKQTNVL